MQPVAERPTDDAAGEEIDDDGQIKPPLTCPDVGDVGTPLLVGSFRLEVLVNEVRCHRPGMLAIGGSFVSSLLAGAQPVLAHQPGRSPAADLQAVFLKLAGHARTAIGAERQGEGRTNVGQQHHVVSLTTTGWAGLPGKITALADAERRAHALNGELLFRHIDEPEPHRLPSRAKKAVARFRMSRSWRRISFSRRSRFNSVAISS